MDRKEFLTLIGMATGGIIISTCFDSCKKDDSSATTALSKDFTLDLTQASNAPLKNNGGFIVTNGVIVARTTAGAYIAVAAACTHQGTTVGFEAANNRFHCSNHGSNFSTTGSVINGPAGTALQQFNTSQTGNNLRIFS
ncbi:MAG: Rieske 2Fe-2S domain-containing protein [Bacteroidota bacterium]